MKKTDHMPSCWICDNHMYNMRPSSRIQKPDLCTMIKIKILFVDMVGIPSTCIDLTYTYMSFL